MSMPFPAEYATSDSEQRHVVVVDDAEPFRRFVARVLEDQHFNVIAAGDFATAIDVIESQERVDLLIADVSLGPGNPHGVALCNMAQLRRGRLKVILMSGSYDVQTVAQYANPAAVLQKPFTAKQLLDAVASVFGRPAAACQPKTSKVLSSNNRA